MVVPTKVSESPASGAPAVMARGSSAFRSTSNAGIRAPVARLNRAIVLLLPSRRATHANWVLSIVITFIAFGVALGDPAKGTIRGGAFRCPPRKTLNSPPLAVRTRTTTAPGRVLSIAAPPPIATGSASVMARVSRSENCPYECGERESNETLSHAGSPCFGGFYSMEGFCLSLLRSSWSA